MGKREKREKTYSTSTKINLVATAGLAALLLVTGGSIVNASFFYDDFSSGTLDSAWQVIEYSGPWPRSEGQTTAANHYTLVNGNLRYIVDPMTYAMGFVNDYQTWSPYYDYDPGLEFHRLFDDNQWVFESKTSYHIPYGNHRGFCTSVVFGDGQTGSTYYVQFSRGRDVSTGSNAYHFGLFVFNADGTWAEGNYTGLFGIDEVVSTDDDSRYFRLDRSGGVLTALWGNDGISWQTIGSYDFGNQLDGLQQRVLLSGSCWFNTAGSYADWDYISLVPEPATMILLAFGGMALLRRKK